MNDREADVLMVNREKRIALLTDNRIVPVTHWFGTRGEECIPANAVTCVAGNDDAGWFAIDLQMFGYAKVH